MQRDRDKYSSGATIEFYDFIKDPPRRGLSALSVRLSRLLSILFRRSRERVKIRALVVYSPRVYHRALGVFQT